MASSTITIDASPDVVMREIADLAGQLEWTSASEVEIYGRDEQGRPLAAKWKESYGPLLNDEFVIEYEWHGPDRLTWNLVDGRILKYEIGEYRLEPAADGKTTVFYFLEVGVAVWVLGAIRNQIEALVTNSSLQALKQRVEAR